MPSRLNQMPGQPNDLAKKVQALERDVRELRAARRLEHSAIGGSSLGSLLTTTQPSVSDWVNVTASPYNAKGDGSSDDTAAIQAALTATPPGGITYMPVGVYRTSAPLNIPPFVTLQSAHGGTEAQSAGWSPPCSIKPLPNFTGVAVIHVIDQQMGGYPRLASEPSIRTLTIDGSAIPSGTTVDGIRGTGQIQGLILRDVQVRKVTGIGINTAYNTSAPPGPQAPFCLHFERVSVLWGANIGIALNNSTDSTFYDVYVLGCSGFGWYISGSDNSTLTACRAEWSGNEGFRLDGGSGVLRMVSCSTDRNQQHGINVSSTTNTGTIVITGAALTRDGKSSSTAGYSGLNVASATRKVIVDGLVVRTGTDDNGTGLLSPQFGVAVTNSAYVTVNSGDLQAVSQGWHDGGGNTTLLRGNNVTGTGITPVTVVSLDAVATDIQPLGTQAAGATGKAADAGHVHAMPRLDQAGAPTAAVGLNSQKITALANGTTATDAAAFGQIPVAGTTAGTYAAGNDSRITGAYPATGGTITGSVYATARALGVPTPQDHGAIAWTFDPAHVTTGTPTTGGTLHLAALFVPRSVTATKLFWGINTAGVTPTAGQNFVGLFSAAGTQLASVGVDARVTQTGLFTETISAALTPGMYWVGFLFNTTPSTSQPQVYRGAALNGTLANLNLTSGANYRYATNGSALTALPASIAPSSNSPMQTCYFAALA